MQTSPVERWRSWWHLLPVLTLIILSGVWFVTWGEWDLFERESFCRYYDALGRSMFEGRFDVPPWAIGFESFLFDGKYYGYFGIGPALLRAPLLLLSDGMDGLWSRWMVFCASLFNLAAALGILRHFRGGPAREARERWLEVIFLFCVGLGSSNLFILSRSFLFHEATAWGSTAALLSAWAVLVYARTGASRWLVAAVAAAFLALHSRATTGAGAVLGLSLLLLSLVWRSRPGATVATEPGSPARWRWQAAGLGLGIVLVAGTYLGVNYAKFRTFNGIPLQYYEMYLREPNRMALTQGRALHLANLPTGLANYLGPRGVEVRSEFPWLYASTQPIRLGEPAIDMAEPFASLPVAMPALTALALLGLVAVVRSQTPALRQGRWLALALLAGGSIVFLSVGITQRYLHDFFPALVVLGAAAIAGDPTGWLRRTGGMVALALLGIWSAAFMAATALTFQRTAAWGVPPEKRAEFLQWRQAWK
ncbi:MAG: hypothetical protein JSR82_12740 [Verrucomicrobia bacterium]|nr:hypothetical protein [Verrucomicrobiota bacterium]